MSVIAGLFLPVAAFILGSITFLQTLIVGAFAFITSLAASRLFEKQIDESTKLVLKHLDRHKKIKAFILKYF